MLITLVFVIAAIAVSAIEHLIEEITTNKDEND